MEQLKQNTDCKALDIINIAGQTNNTTTKKTNEMNFSDVLNIVSIDNSSEATNTSIFNNDTKVKDNNTEMKNVDTEIVDLTKLDIDIEKQTKEEILENTDIKVDINTKIENENNKNQSATENPILNNVITENQIHLNNSNINTELTLENLNTIIKQDDINLQIGIPKEENTEKNMLLNDRSNLNLLKDKKIENKSLQETLKESVIKEFKLTQADESLSEPEPKQINKTDVFRQIQKGISNASTMKNITIMLKPQSLGRVNVNINFKNNGMYMNFYVDSPEIENILQENLTQLTKMLTNSDAVKVNAINIHNRTEIFNNKTKKNRNDYLYLKKKSISEKLEDTPLFLI